ncbi:YihY/virulence factor BrkB family protein [Leucobacter massiliensis]|uniref:YihY/virulence factor BrkB family protein n=1 Tax=Leucobacter massiliensis TaxID=1686285 RepID=A0A2S9QNB4_9MICO|nr:YhjD/YihY/BrkB family envelope integrity protein [Leucobacter massiliensis]PRI11093.1 hypothetical protein B4915_09545 [Leucobacter massiliensis]
MTTPRDASPPDGRGASGASSSSGFAAVWSRLRDRALRSRPWRTFSHFIDVGGNVLSGGMSYQALFAVFAGLWIGFGVFGIVLRGRPELLDTLVEQINTFVPGLLGTNGDEGAVQLGTLLEARALDWTSVVAGAVLLWVALNWFTGTRRSIRIIFGLDVKQYRNPVLLKLRDLLLAIGFFSALLVSAGLTVLSSKLSDQFFAWAGADPGHWFFGGLGATVRYGALLVFDVVVLIAMHRLLAEVRVPVWRLVRGCLLGGTVMLALKMLGGTLLGGASSNPLLATFTVFVGLLVWFNLICRTLLLTSAWIATGLDRSLGLPDTSAGPAQRAG